MPDLLAVALAFLVSQCLVVACCVYVGRRWYERERRRVQDDISQAVHDLITAPDENTPSPLAVLIDQGALLLSSRLIQHLKAMLAGTESALSKAEGTERQLELLQSAPSWVSVVAGILPPRLRKQLLANPQMIGALSNLVGANKGGGNHSTDTGGSVRDRLQRQ